MNKSKYQEALKRLLRNRYNSNIKLVGTNYGLKEVRSITKKGRLDKQEDLRLLQELVDKETPKKPIAIKNMIVCPNCKCEDIIEEFPCEEKDDDLNEIYITYDTKFNKRCPKCNQALYWSEDD